MHGTRYSAADSRLIALFLATLQEEIREQNPIDVIRPCLLPYSQSKRSSIASSECLCCTVQAYRLTPIHRNYMLKIYTCQDTFANFCPFKAYFQRKMPIYSQKLALYQPSDTILRLFTSCKGRNFFLPQPRRYGRREIAYRYPPPSCPQSKAKKNLEKSLKIARFFKG